MQSSAVSFEIKRLEGRSFIVAMVTNSPGSAGLKIMIEKKKSGIFLRFRTDTVFLSQDLKSKAQNYPLHQILTQSIQKQRNNEDVPHCWLSQHQNDNYDVIISN